jgi:hypothetical protein
MSVALLLLRSGAGAHRTLPRALLSSAPANTLTALWAQRHSSTLSGRGGAGNGTGTGTGTGSRAAGAESPPVLSRDRARSIMDRIRGSMKPSAPPAGDSADAAQSVQQQQPPPNDPFYAAAGPKSAHSTAGIRSVQNEV